MIEPAPVQDPVDPASVRRILLLRPRFIGDICLTLPALGALRTACPAARVAYLLESECAPLLASDPRVNELIVVSRKTSAREWIATVSRLRRFAPDVAIDFFCNPRTAIWTFASGAPVRVGYEGKGWRSELYTHRVRPRTLSAVGFHLASVARLGWPAPDVVPRLTIGEAALREADLTLEQVGVPAGARLLGLHPGARWPTRRWDPERFVELARRFLAHDPLGFALVTGGPGEEDRARAVADALPDGRALPIVGWPLARFVALQSRCAAFVCGDSGPLHTAVAAGTPTLGLMSRNRPAMFFPYPQASGHRAYYARVECSPCDRDVCEDLRCLTRLTADGAWALLAPMLASLSVAAQASDVR